MRGQIHTYSPKYSVKIIERNQLGSLVDKNTRLIVQGITGKEAVSHAAERDTVERGRRRTPARAHDARGRPVLIPWQTLFGKPGRTRRSSTFAGIAADAIMEAGDSDFRCRCIPEAFRSRIWQSKNISARKTRVMGPNCPASFRRKCRSASAGHIHKEGRIAWFHVGNVTYKRGQLKHRARAVDRYRDRRRSDYRHDPHGCSEVVPGRRRDRCDRDDR